MQSQGSSLIKLGDEKALRFSDNDPHIHTVFCCAKALIWNFIKKYKRKPFGRLHRTTELIKYAANKLSAMEKYSYQRGRRIQCCRESLKFETYRTKFKLGFEFWL